MNRWFKVTIKGRVQAEKGEKKLTDQYLFDAMTFTECEKVVLETLKPYYQSFEISKIDPFKVSEIFKGEGDRYFKCKVNYITLDEKSGKERKQPVYMLVQASTTKEAEDNLKEGMKGTLGDWSIEAIAETKLIDVYEYDLKKASEELKEQADPHSLL